MKQLEDNFNVNDTETNENYQKGRENLEKYKKLGKDIESIMKENKDLFTDFIDKSLRNEERDALDKMM
jgi:hypothetical protein